LELHIAATRTEIDELNTALRLLRGTRDPELEALIIKWRGAARAACEELFAGVKDKVNRMGGVGAWREKERAIVDRRAAWAEEDRRAATEIVSEEEDDDDDGDNEEGGDAESNAEKKMKREERRQARREMREAQAYEVSEYDRAAEEESKGKDSRFDVGQDDDVRLMIMGTWGILVLLTWRTGFHDGYDAEGFRH